MEESDAGTNAIVFLFFGLLIVGAIFIVKFFDIDFFEGDEIKAYSATCKTRVDEFGICDNPEGAQGITTYKVSYGSQRVISDNGGLVNKYTDCTVKDRKNWECSFDDKSGDFGFISGTYFSSVNWEKIGLYRDLVEKSYHPSRLEYIDLKVRAWECEGLMYPMCYIFTVVTN